MQASTIEQPTQQPIKSPRARPRKEKPIEPVVKRTRDRPRVGQPPKEKTLNCDWKYM